MAGEALRRSEKQILRREFRPLVTISFINEISSPRCHEDHKIGTALVPLIGERGPITVPIPRHPVVGPTLSKVNCGHQWAQVGLRQAFCASIPDVMYDTAIHPALGTFGVRTGTVCHAYKKRVPSPRTDLSLVQLFVGLVFTFGCIGLLGYGLLVLSGPDPLGKRVSS